MNVSDTFIELVESIDLVRNQTIFVASFYIVVISIPIGVLLNTMLIIFFLRTSLYDRSLRLLVGTFAFSSILFSVWSLIIGFRNTFTPSSNLVRNGRSCAVQLNSGVALYFFSIFLHPFIALDRSIATMRNSRNGPYSENHIFWAIFGIFGSLSITGLVVANIIMKADAKEMVACIGLKSSSIQSLIAAEALLLFISILSITALYANRSINRRKLMNFHYEGETALKIKYELSTAFETNNALLPQFTIFLSSVIVGCSVSFLVAKFQDDVSWRTKITRCNMVLLQVFSYSNVMFLLFSKMKMGEDFRKFYKLEKLSVIMPWMRRNKIAPKDNNMNAQKAYFEDLRNAWDERYPD